MARSVNPTPPPPIPDHELVRCVGVGSYGEVWLARNLLGTFRAVKIIYRGKFDSDRPFDREFIGIQKFEPVSRTHPGLVSILHVGRNTEAGCFYYIMELADDAEAGAAIDPDRYKPRTLSGELARRGRLNLAECVKLGQSLAGALDHLHNNGLVHRDVKPSNIIFVNGVPKFADVGLVTKIGEPATFVGTESYIPREGPGSPTADVFGLGKVLYQIATGRSADAFPELPTFTDDEPIEEVMRLNPIFLKACDENPRHRYQSASEMGAALALAGHDLPATSRAPAATPTPANAPERTSRTSRRDIFVPKNFRVALLYKAAAQPDLRLLNLLRSELTDSGCEVFVDTQLAIGVEWAQAIETQIRSADAVVVLISAASVESEMIACEVEIAGQSRQQNGRPIILPVRVQFEEALPEGLGLVLNRLQHFLWKSPEDDQRLIEELFRALDASQCTPSSGGKPQLESIGGAVPLASQFYVVRPSDHEFQQAMARRDSIVLVKGARQMGKTSLLARGLQQARQSGAKVVLSDFQKLNTSHLSSVETFYKTLADFLADQLDLEVLPGEIFDARRGANTNFERYLRREVLGKLTQHLVWGMDEVDRLFTSPFGSEVFGLFRSWHNERALDPGGPWSRLTLAIAYATEAHLFITDVNQSPFNVGTRLMLEDFTFDQVTDLNRRYGTPLKTGAELEQLHALLGGHPYLVRRALNELAAGTVSFEQFILQADRDEGFFGDHLRRMLVLLARDTELVQVVRGVLAGRPCPDPASFYRLRSAGVMKGDSPEHVAPRCGIYATYLKGHLA